MERTMRDGKVLSVISISWIEFPSFSSFLSSFFPLSSFLSLLGTHFENMKLVQVREMVVKIFLERSLGMQAVLFSTTFSLPIFATSLFPTFLHVLISWMESGVRNVISPRWKTLKLGRVWFVQESDDTFGIWVKRENQSQPQISISFLVSFIPLFTTLLSPFGLFSLFILLTCVKWCDKGGIPSGVDVLIMETRRGVFWIEIAVHLYLVKKCGLKACSHFHFFFSLPCHPLFVSLSFQYFSLYFISSLAFEF